MGSEFQTNFKFGWHHKAGDVLGALQLDSMQWWDVILYFICTLPILYFHFMQPFTFLLHYSSEENIALLTPLHLSDSVIY